MSTMIRRSTLVVFPALALVFSASCAVAGSAPAAQESVAPAATAGVVGAAPALSTQPASKSAVPAATALDLLSAIVVRKETPAGYQRSKFRHWVDADGDSCNTREEVLIAESSSTAQVSYPGCRVVEGDWVSAYDGVAVTDPSGIDIDHFVPLKEAWDSGANAWSPAKRQTYANDLSDARALIAVTSGSNRSKGEKDPPQWMPKNTAYTCTYLSNWVAVKAHWSLAMDESEYGFIAKRLKGACAGVTAPAWGVADGPYGTPASGGSTAPTVPATGVSTPTTPAATDTTVAKGSVAATVNPGSYCSPTGATGYSTAGKKYVCSTTNAAGTPYAGGRAHWRPA